MDFETFYEITKITKAKKPFLFELGHDAIPTMEHIFTLQKQHQVILPEKYIQFISNFGGGYFGYANIYSLDKNSYFYLANHNKKVLGKLLFIADNECGDYYAFCIKCGKCKDAIVFYNHDENTICATEFSDIFEFLIKMGLNQ